METAERTAPETAQPRQRRVGTFTLGVTLVAAGGLMLAAMFFPALDLWWVLKCSPVILILLGVETLLAARGGGRIKYDWLGMNKESLRESAVRRSRPAIEMRCSRCFSAAK